MLLARRLRLSDVLQHRVVVLEPGERAHSAQLRLRFGDELLVAELEVPLRPDVLTERLRRTHFGRPLARETGSVLRMAPPLRHDPVGDREERQRRVTPVADQVHEPGVREQPLEERQMLHVERRLVAPARLPALGGVRLEDGGDGVARRHPRAKASGDRVRGEAPFDERRETA